MPVAAKSPGLHAEPVDGEFRVDREDVAEHRVDVVGVLSPAHRSDADEFHVVQVDSGVGVPGGNREKQFSVAS